MAAPVPSPVELGQRHNAVIGAPAKLRSYRAAAMAGIVVSALALWALCVWRPLGAFPFAFLRYVVTAYVLLTAGLAWMVTYGVAWVLRRGKGMRQVAGMTAMTALWLAPLAIFLRDRSEWALLAVGALVISVTRLLVWLDVPGASPSLEPLRVRFGLIESSIPAAELAPILIAVLSIEGAFAASLAARPLWAALLIALGAWLCVRQYHQHSPPDVTRKRRPGLRVALASALMVLALLPHLLLPVGPGGRGGFVPAGGGEWSLIGAVKLLLGLGPGGTGVPAGRDESRGHTRGAGDSDPQIAGKPFPGIVLFPESAARVTTLVAPPPVLPGENDFFGTRHDQPLTIPFSGVYWILRQPDGPPPESSLVQRGNPAREGFVSNDFRPLWMEAHQMLGTSIHLECCSAVRVELTDADYASGQITVELLLSDSRGHTKEALGLRPVVSGPADSLAQRPQRRVLTFPFPRNPRISSFDEITVHFWLTWRHANRSARISLDQFVLVPRGR